jgi:hypothetical protein
LCRDAFKVEINALPDSAQRYLHLPLLDGIEHGTTMGFETRPPHSFCPQRRFSSNADDSLRAGLERDQQRGFIHGPFAFEDVRRVVAQLGLGEHAIASPMFQVDKESFPPLPKSAKRRVCHYSYSSKGGPPSVNSFVDSDDYQCRWYLIRAICHAVRLYSDPNATDNATDNA